MPRPMKIQMNSKVTLKEQRIRIRKADGTQTLERCGLRCSLKNRSWNIGLRPYKPSLKGSGTGPTGALSKGSKASARRQMAVPSLCQNEMKQMRSSSRYILETVIRLIIVAKEVKGGRKVEILNARETKDREKRSGTAVHTQTTGKS